jgi:hypothetical protein
LRRLRGYAGLSAAAAAAPNVDVSPQGVRRWLAEPARSAERDVIEHLLSRTPAPVDVRALSARCGRPVPEVVRGLFRLNRSDGLVVGADARGSPADTALSGLAGDLCLLVPDGAAVLADGDGLCIAACGWDRPAAERISARAPALGAQAASARWWFAVGEVILLASRPPDQRSPVWVRIARRLLHACGTLAPGVR